MKRNPVTQPTVGKLSKGERLRDWAARKRRFKRSDEEPQLIIGKLSKGERLYLERRRRGESTTEAAARYGVGRNKFANWERERDAVSDAPSVSLKSEPKPHEACQILRRRAGLEISELAEQVGVSRYWLRQMESGQVSVSRLVQHWAGRQRPWKRSEALAQQTA